MSFCVLIPNDDLQQKYETNTKFATLKNRKMMNVIMPNTE